MKVIANLTDKYLNEKSITPSKVLEFMGCAPAAIKQIESGITLQDPYVKFLMLIVKSD